MPQAGAWNLPGATPVLRPMLPHSRGCGERFFTLGRAAMMPALGRAEKPAERERTGQDIGLSNQGPSVPKRSLPGRSGFGVLSRSN